MAALKREFEALFGTPPELSPEEKLLKRRDRRKRKLREHTRSYVIVNTFLASLWLVLGLTTGAWFPWFLFPLLGWGMGYTFHAVGTASWLAENRRAIAQAESRLGIAAPAEEGGRWKALRARCEAAVRKAHQALAQSVADDDKIHDGLQQGLEQTLALLDGAERLDRTLATLSPNGTQGLQAELARVEGAWSEARDEGLKDLHAQNRALLQSRREKIEAMLVERERIVATVEGFIIAADNLQLDALRLGRGEPLLALQEPVKRLQDELEILEKVRSELMSVEP